MTTPEKDQVFSAVNVDEQDAGSVPSQAGVAQDGAAAADAEAVQAEVIEGPAAEAQAGAAQPDAATDAAPSAADIVSEAEALLAESEAVKAAQAQAAEWQDKYLRLHAEWDTYRRRTNEQRAAEKLRATEKLVGNLLPVLDDFERTIAYANDNGEAGLLGGVQAVHNKLVDVLKKDGVEVIDPQGEAFDALEAQAVATVPDASVPDETVAQVYQKGYRMGAKVLRPAMVTVTTGGPKREEPAEAEAAE